MKWMLCVFAVLSSGIPALSVNPDLLRTEKIFIEKMRSIKAKIITETFGITGYECDLTASEPQTIHELSPKFVDVVGAMGDSITAGFGALSSDETEVDMQFRGVSWTIGGDGALEEVATLPNILRVFNPAVKGASRFVGGVEHPNSKLNLAVGGSKSAQMLGQAEDLVNRLNEMENNVDNWKVISIWIGGNDLCEIRDDGTTPEEYARGYIQNVKAALDYLHANVQRAFVNVMLVVDITGMPAFYGPMCDLVQGVFCRPLNDDTTLELMAQTYRLYNAGLQKLISAGTNYDDRDDFTVVLQPFLSETEFATFPPEHIIPDMTYIAYDCFHFSQKSHAVAARYLWNNMFQPVGAKTRSINWETPEELACPVNYPYFATYQNSLNRGEGVQKEEL